MISPAAALALVNIIMAPTYCGGRCHTRLRWRFLAEKVSVLPVKTLLPSSLLVCFQSSLGRKISKKIHKRSVPEVLKTSPGMFVCTNELLRERKRWFQKQPFQDGSIIP